MKCRLYILIIIILMAISINILPAKPKKNKNFGPWNSKLVKNEQKKIHTVRQLPSTTSWFFNRFIRIFQLYISPQDGPNCRYHPTCAKYGEICINRYGLFLGIIMTADRYMRCNPFGPTGRDLPEENYFRDKKKNK